MSLMMERYLMNAGICTSHMRELLSVVEDVVPFDWRKRKVKNPATGNTVQVGSLPPKEQEKYRPKKKVDHPSAPPKSDTPKNSSPSNPSDEELAKAKEQLKRMQQKATGHFQDFAKKTTKELGIPDWELVDRHLVNKKTGEKIKAKGAYNTLHKQLIGLAQR